MTIETEPIIVHKFVIFSSGINISANAILEINETDVNKANTVVLEYDIARKYTTFPKKYAVKPYTMINTYINQFLLNKYDQSSNNIPNTL